MTHFGTVFDVQTATPLVVWTALWVISLLSALRRRPALAYCVVAHPLARPVAWDSTGRSSERGVGCATSTR